MTVNLLSVIIIILIIAVIYLIFTKVTYTEPNTPGVVSTVVDNSSIENLASRPIIKKSNKKKHKKKVKFDIPEKFKKPKEDLVFLDVGTSEKYYGKIVIKLFSNIVPKTCTNFRTLCETKKYYNAPFHRIIKDFMIQSGDFTKFNGTGGQSIYGEKFPDENFEIPHDRPFLLSMANSGPNSNGSQFFITTGEAPHLNNKHVVFGEVIIGFDVVDALNEVDTGENDRPIENIKILNCGLFDKSKMYKKK